MLVPTLQPLTPAAPGFRTRASCPLPAACILLLAALSPGFGAGLDTLRLTPGERIMVLAPHPDDDVVVCGGLIRHALAMGDSVLVVCMTSGDASWPAATTATGRLLPRRTDYIRLGRARQREATSADSVLGLAPGALRFLGYPDGALARLWQDHWQVPFASPWTRATRSPYDSTGREYRGADVLADLVDVIGSFRPDRVFAPHPDDAHPDHWSTAMFLELAREVWARSHDAPFPGVYRYLVHRASYPRRLVAADRTLSPPRDLRGRNHHWLTLPLDNADRQRKAAALAFHKSQRRSPVGKLAPYVTANELFDTFALDAGAVVEDAPRGPYAWLAGAPVFDTVAVRPEGDSLRVRVALRSEPRPYGSYNLYLHAVADSGAKIVQSGLVVRLLPFAGSSVRTLRPGTVRVARTDRFGWTFALPKSLLARTGTLFYAADAGPRSLLLASHSAIGRVSY